MSRIKGKVDQSNRNPAFRAQPRKGWRYGDVPGPCADWDGPMVCEEGPTLTSLRTHTSRLNNAYPDDRMGGDYQRGRR